MMDSLALANIREAWGEIRPGLEHVRQRTEAPWRVEDVYAACLVGQAFLYVGEPGFIVVQPQEDKLSGEPELLVWVAYSSDHGSVDRFQPAVDALARDKGFKKLVMWSTRPGWEKNDGWKAVATVYERAV
jgi:hypothetical protein